MPQADEKDKKIGKIFMGPASSNEATMESLDAMQAAARREQQHQRSLAGLEETVKARAIEKAKLIIGQAYEEREKILAEARAEARRIIGAAGLELQKAAEARAEAQRLSDSAKDIENEAARKFEGARDEGFDAGLEAAREELKTFRAAMGDSIVAVLTAISGQCLAVFDDWRRELEETVKVCVEKTTGYALKADRRDILSALLAEAVAQFDKKRALTLRVSPQDEEAVADIISAARERHAGVESWSVRADAGMEPGGLVVESEYGAVDSRMEVRRAVVENIIRNLTIPKSEADEVAMRVVAEALNSAAEAVAPLAHPDGLPVAAPEESSVSPELAAGAEPGLSVRVGALAGAPDGEGAEAPQCAAPVFAPDGADYGMDPGAAPEAAYAVRAAEFAPEADAPGAGVAPASEAAAPMGHPAPAPGMRPAPEAAPVAGMGAGPAPGSELDALERELLPLPEAEEHGLAETLAEGGFLPPKAG